MINYDKNKVLYIYLSEKKVLNLVFCDNYLYETTNTLRSGM